MKLEPRGNHTTDPFTEIEFYQESVSFNEAQHDLEHGISELLEVFCVKYGIVPTALNVQYWPPGTYLKEAMYIQVKTAFDSKIKGW